MASSLVITNSRPVTRDDSKRVGSHKLPTQRSEVIPHKPHRQPIDFSNPNSDDLKVRGFSGSHTSLDRINAGGVVDTGNERLQSASPESKSLPSQINNDETLLDPPWYEIMESSDTGDERGVVKENKTKENKTPKIQRTVGGKGNGYERFEKAQNDEELGNTNGQHHSFEILRALRHNQPQEPGAAAAEKDQRRILEHMVSSDLHMLNPLMGDDDNKKKKVGQYLLGQTIGEGSFAKVRIANHLISKQEVAIKVVPKRLLVLREAARRHFRREALLLQKLSHPNIVKLYEVMETSNCYYLVYQLVSGGNLLSYILDRGQLTEDESRVCMRQMVSAVDHIHKTGIAHRDLKLENFLLDDTNTIKLIDLGLSSTCHDSDHALSTQCGSPVYAAPELFAGRKYGKAVDIWSLGVCLFAMLTGRLPFLPPDGSSLSQLYSLILRGCPVPDNLSLSCQNLLRRMLEIQASRRIPIEDVLTHLWMIAPDGQPIKRYHPITKNPPANVINPALVRYMCTMFRFSESDVLTSVMERKLCASAATYNIFKDGIEAGKISLSFVTEPARNETRKLVRESLNLPSLTKAKTRPNRLSGSSRRHSASQNSTGSNDAEDVGINGNHGSSTQESITVGQLASYKECLIGLKRTRQRLSKAGSKPLELNDTMSFEQLNDEQYFPSLAPGADMGIGTRAEHWGRLENNNGVRFYTTEGLNLGVKGISPWIQQRNTSSSIGFSSPKHLSDHKPALSSLDVNANTILTTHKTPPPPPPNSSFGNQSLALNSVRQRGNAHMYKLSPVLKQTSQPNPAPTSQTPARSFSEPPRPSLSKLRDSYRNELRDTRKATFNSDIIKKRTARLLRSQLQQQRDDQQQLQSPQNSQSQHEHDRLQQLSRLSAGQRADVNGGLSRYHAWSKNDLWERGKSYVTWADTSPGRRQYNPITSGGGNRLDVKERYVDKGTQGQPMSHTAVKEEKNHVIKKVDNLLLDDAGIGRSITSRDGTDSSLSQSQEIDEHPMPVMSVIINVRS